MIPAAPQYLRSLDLILIVPGTPLEELLPGVIPWLEKGCAYEAEWDLAGIAQEWAAGRFHIWAAWQKNPPACKAAFVTRISENKRGEKIAWDVVMAGENMDRVVPLLDRIEDFYREQGFAFLRIIGRPGWKKKLPGYRQRAVLLEKRLMT